MEAPEGMNAIDVVGRRLAYRTLGSGPPLLLVNGYAATAMDWDPAFLAALAESFTVICPDNRGMGGSDPSPDDEPLTVDAMAADLELLLDALGLESAPVAGWSMGGFVAQRLATRAPACVAALVLLGTAPGGASAVSSKPPVWAQLTDHSGTPREQATRLVGLLFPPPLAAQIDEQFGDLVAAARAQLSHPALSAQEAAIRAWHAQEPPPPGDAAPRVLVAHGSEDVVLPAANADALAAHWPDCRVERFDGCGHAFMAQEPVRLAESIRAFVQA